MTILNIKLFGEDVEKVPTRFGYGEALVKLGEIDPNVVVLTGDLADSTKVSDFAKKYPDRFVECGVAEQNMTGIAAGMAAAGKTPFISSYAVFSPGRAWDQVRVSVCYSNLNVKIAGAHTGVSVGPDGATHQALEDIAIMRCLPNMTVVVPCDSIETKKLTIQAARRPGPVYFRFAREKTAVMTTEEAEFEIGKAYVMFEAGNDAVVVGCGPLLYQALLAAKQLESEGIKITVVNNHTVKPLDEATLFNVAKSCGAMVTVEEHQVHGGMGSAVAEFLATHMPIPVEFVGMQDSFGESGQPEELLEKYQMSVDVIKKAVVKVIARKKYDKASSE